MPWWPWPCPAPGCAAWSRGWHWPAAGQSNRASWPQELPADPVNALRSLVSRLRRVLGEAGAVTQSEGGYRLGVTEDEQPARRSDQLHRA